jgi:hypothetical protein
MESYSMEHRDADGYTGYAIIFNNYSFENQRTGDPEPRKGSEQDVENIITSLQRLNFKVREPFVDLTARKMKAKLFDLVENEEKRVDFSQYSTFVCVVMSHGDSNGIIYGLDHRPVRLDEDIVEIFRDCEQLRGKPKLFFVQACRGWQHTKVFEVDSEHDNNTLRSSDLMGEEKRSLRLAGSSRGRAAPSYYADDDDFTDARREVVRKVGDIIVHYATVEQYVALRNQRIDGVRILGSCFIQSLCSVLNKYGTNEQHDLLRLLTMVNCVVANKYECQQPDIVTNSLNKLLYFQNGQDRIRTRPATASNAENDGSRIEESMDRK